MAYQDREIDEEIHAFGAQRGSPVNRHFVQLRWAEQGDVTISMFLVEAPPGRGAPLHVHEFDEIVLLQEAGRDS
jgi:hypothetical protein